MSRLRAVDQTVIAKVNEQRYLDLKADRVMRFALLAQQSAEQRKQEREQRKKEKSNVWWDNKKEEEVAS